MRRFLAHSGLKLSLAMLLLVQAACGESDEPTALTPAPSAQRGELVAVTASTTVSLGEVQLAIALLEAAGIDTSGLDGKYGVSIHTLVYKTATPDGRLIDASGVVAYPLKLGGAPSPLLSYQHPTLFTDDDAPSLSANTDNVLKLLAGIGFIVVMPDYIGYAESADEVHPYVQAQGLAAAVVDMIRAARTLLARNGIAGNGQLFLTGYSEGGYATLAAHKEMEQNLAAEFGVTASMPAAGPYDMSATAQYMVGLDINDNPQFLGFVFKAYDHWHGWNRLDDMFQAPYNNVIATYYDGTQSSGAVQAALTTSMADLFTPAFRDEFLGGGEATVKAGFAANDIYDWAPQAPTRLFHGEDDDIVPHFNAETAETVMLAAGAPDVSLVNCTTPLTSIPRNHENCVVDYLSEVVVWFGSLATDL
jgi:predicted esterase